MHHYFRYGCFSLLSLLMALAFWLVAAPPSQAHWADMAAAEIVVDEATMQMTLTFPTGLASFADDDRSGQFSPSEVHAHANELRDFLNQQIQVTNSENWSGVLTVDSIEAANLPATVQIAPNTHSTLRLNYVWDRPLQGLRIHYDLFLPNVATASCLATILQAGQLKTFVFTPRQQSFAIAAGLGDYAAQGLVVAIAGAFLWGAVHSLSPGHGKTIVAAYLVGERATPKHAIFLALTTTITHTIGVFALGLVTLFAAQYLLPEQIYPWLSLFSGLLVASIGFNLLRDRVRRSRAQPATKAASTYPHEHQHPHVHAHAYAHSHAHNAHHSHPHPPHALAHSHHAHDHHAHAHLPPDANGAPVTWRNLLALGISGGLIPCPAALVLLLSAIALGNTGVGLLLVLAFSLGLAGVLTSLGLLMVYAKRVFQRVPTQMRWIKILPTLSAIGILLIGCGISTKALLTLGL
jgi:ABC-type nickel/cobalt efflux system permease component RcnA